MNENVDPSEDASEARSIEDVSEMSSNKDTSVTCLNGDASETCSNEDASETRLNEDLHTFEQGPSHVQMRTFMPSNETWTRSFCLRNASKLYLVSDG